MNVDSLVNNLQAALGRLGQNLVVQADSGFNNSLTLGQVLKGKVLMHYDGTRYGVSFGGQERVVDSAVPLRAGEVIYGRVVGLGDKVHLQRQVGPEAGQGHGSEPETPPLGQQQTGMNARERLVAQLFDRYQGQLTAKEQGLLVRLMGKTGRPELTVLSALVLNKLGFELSAEAVQGVLRVLERERPAALRQVAEVPQLALGDGAVGKNPSEEIAPLARVLQGLLELSEDGWQREGLDDAEPVPGRGAPERVGVQGSDMAGGEGDAEQRREPDYLGTWLLNGQSEGSVAHRTSTFPLWFGERLIEVSIALFNQRQQVMGQGELRHRRIVLALDTEQLGHVELVANLAKDNLSLEVRAQDDEATETLADHLPALRSQLTALGWTVDGISYATVAPGERGEVVRSVVEHFVTQDSVNQLI